jgi:hypothetical protein
MSRLAGPSVYGKHFAPHDIRVRELASGRSRLETAASLGTRFEVCPNVPIEEGIHAARMLLPRCWFDAQRCRAGLEALHHYRRDYNSRLHEFKATPVHDWASQAADAFRGFQAAREISVRMLQDDIDVFRGARAIAQAELKRDASLHDEPGIAPISGAFAYTGHDHVRDPGADTSFADAYLARVRLRILW